MKQFSNIVKSGGSTYLLLPPALVEYLNLQIGENEVMIEDKEKSKGKYAAFWKPSQKQKDAKDMI